MPLPHKNWGFKKHLGQHFLQDQNILWKIANAANLQPTDTVVEIGPGKGSLTRLLLQKAGRVIAIEKDTTLREYWETEFQTAQNLELHFGDFLKFDLQSIATTPNKLKVIGNIPYNISSPILFQLLEHRKIISVAVLTMQKEVAQRIAALPDNKNYGIITILTQIYANASLLFDIQAGSFTPPPKVTSSTIRLSFPDVMPYPLEAHEELRQLVKRAFGKRRKTFENTLKGFYPPELILNALKWCHLDPKVRPENVTVAQYVALANTIKSLYTEVS